MRGANIAKIGIKRQRTFRVRRISLHGSGLPHRSCSLLWAASGYGRRAFADPQMCVDRNLYQVQDQGEQGGRGERTGDDQD